jgi:hypothetical protein
MWHRTKFQIKREFLDKDNRFQCKFDGYQTFFCSNKCESRLEGVDRWNLKIINLSTHYKPGLALELNTSPKEMGKQINQEIKRMNTVICFTEVRFQRT